MTCISDKVAKPTVYLCFMQNIFLPSIFPETSTIILHLLREEIRFRKLTRILEKAHIDIERYAPNLSSLTLSLCAFENLCDKLLLWVH
jgi:hypothetical protein